MINLVMRNKLCAYTRSVSETRLTNFKIRDAGNKTRIYTTSLNTFSSSIQMSAPLFVILMLLPDFYDIVV